MKIIYKIIITSISLILVITNTFYDIRINTNKFKTNTENIVGEYYIKNYSNNVYLPYKKINLINIDVSKNVISAKADNIIMDVIRNIVISIYLSLGANNSAKLIETTAENFFNWWKDNEDINQCPDYIGGCPAYLQNYIENTNQATTKSSYGVPKEIVQKIYDDGSWYIEHSLTNPTKWIGYKNINYGSNSYSMITINGIAPYYVSGLYINSSLTVKSLAYNYKGQKIFYYTKSGIVHSIQKVQITDETFRLKLTVKNPDIPANDLYVFYTDTLTLTQINNLNNATQMDLFIQDQQFVLVPYFDNVTAEDIFGGYIPFKNLTLQSIENKIVSIYDIPKFIIDVGNNTTSISGIGNVIDENNNGFPIGYNGNTNANYYDIPVNNGSSNSTSPVPIPTENEGPYVYVPPTTTPGNNTTDWTDLNNPNNAPTATAENTLNGSIFQMIGNWFVSLYYGAINAVMGFWEAFVNGLFSLLNGIKDALLVPLVAMQQGIDVIKEAQLPGIDPIIGLAQFIIDSLSGIINILILLVTSVISAVVSFFYLISSLLNILPIQIRPLFQFILGTLSMMIIVKLFGLVFGFIGQIVGVVK